MATAATWPSYTDTLASLINDSAWIPDTILKDPQARAEFERFVTMLNTMSFFNSVYQSTRYPDFWPCYSTCFPVGFNNPDDVYLITPLDDYGVYHISGRRGTVRILEMEVGTSPTQAIGHGGWGQTLSNFNIDRDTHVDADGKFDVILSATRPADAADWWELKQGARFLLVRQRAYDWLNEKDARLAIERLDVPALRPRASVDGIEAQLANMPKSAYTWAHDMLQWFAALENDGLINRVKAFDNWANSSLADDLGVGGGLTLQAYVQGTFHIEPDEAIVLETDVPDPCNYWMFHLTDPFMSSIDQIHRQSSINGHQAVIDADGKFRAVISAQDPGVPNWLDTGGHLRGGISGRWMECPDYPTPTITKVRLGDLRAALPPSTAIVTPEERDRAVRLRRQGAQMRCRW